MGTVVSAMIYFKACPRCRGDMTLGKDFYGCYLECLQCGYEEEVHEVTEGAKTSPEAKDRVRVGAA